MMYGLYDNYGGWGYGMMGGLFGGFMMALFWVALVLFIVWIVREVIGKRHAPSSRPLDILKERYAKGEINKEEFEAKKKDIG